MAICWERAVPFAFHLCCFYSSAVLIVGVPFPFGVWGRIWTLIVLVPDYCLFIYLVTCNVLSSLPMSTKIIIYGFVKKFVRPLFLFFG